MLRDLGKLRHELERISRPRKVLITPTPDGPAIEVNVGDEIGIVYQGETRQIRILAITSWGIRARDLDKRATRAFRFDRIGTTGDGTSVTEETDEAAQ